MSDDEEQHDPMIGEVVASYRLSAVLGCGEFSKVYKGESLKDTSVVAIKVVLDVELQDINKHNKVKKEVDALQELRHPNILRIYNTLEDADKFCLLLEYAPYGDMLEFYLNHGSPPPSIVQYWYHQVVCAVNFLHTQGYIHRDLKLENFLLDSRLHVKIADFGFIARVDPSYAHLTWLKLACGSPAYAAPEIISMPDDSNEETYQLDVLENDEGTELNGYLGPPIDVWCLGVCLYAMTCGWLPFEDDDTDLLYNSILAAKYQDPTDAPIEAQELIALMLVPNPKERLTLAEVLHHTYIEQRVDDTVFAIQVQDFLRSVSLDESTESNLEPQASHYPLQHPTYRQAKGSYASPISPLLQEESTHAEDLGEEVIADLEIDSEHASSTSGSYNFDNQDSLDELGHLKALSILKSADSAENQTTTVFLQEDHSIPTSASIEEQPGNGQLPEISNPLLQRKESLHEIEMLLADFPSNHYTDKIPTEAIYYIRLLNHYLYEDPSFSNSEQSNLKLLDVLSFYDVAGLFLEHIHHQMKTASNLHILSILLLTQSWLESKIGGRLDALLDSSEPMNSLERTLLSINEIVPQLISNIGCDERKETLTCFQNLLLQPIPHQLKESIYEDMIKPTAGFLKRIQEHVFLSKAFQLIAQSYFKSLDVDLLDRLFQHGKYTCGLGISMKFLVSTWESWIKHNWFGGLCEVKLQFFPLTRQLADALTLSKATLLDEKLHTSGIPKKVCPDLTVEQLDYILQNYDHDMFDHYGVAPGVQEGFRRLSVGFGQTPLIVSVLLDVRPPSPQGSAPKIIHPRAPDWMIMSLAQYLSDPSLAVPNTPLLKKYSFLNPSFAE